MKIGKKIFICILLVLMLICCINASSAQDTLDDTLGAVTIDDAPSEKLSANGDTIVVDVNGEGQFTSISAAVSNATGGETILVMNGEYSEANTITFTKSVSIVGESQDGVKITGAAKSLFSTVEPAIVLSFTNLTILNAGGGSNAALKLTSSAHDLTVINCTFDSCGSKWGTIQLGHPGTAIIDNCKILNSKETTSAGAGAVYASGAGQYTISNTIIDNVQYIPTSSYMQAAIYVSNANAVLNIENTTISNITAPTRGVIQTTGTVNIKGSKIQDNTLNQFSDSMTSHVIYLGDKGTVNIEQTEISDNTCVSQLFNNYKDTSKLAVNYCNIHDNAASATVNNLGTIDLEANWWGSNDKPADVTADTWVVDNNGNYELNNGEPLAKEIPGLNGGDEPPVLPEGTIYVSESGNDENDGLSEENAIATIAHAVEIVNARENKTATVYILNGDYTTAPVDITEVNLTFIGQEKGKVIIHGSGKYIFDVYGDHLISKFENIDFVDSYSPSGNVGALRLYADYSEFTINNCNFRNISAKYGAIDLQADYGNINITNCVIEDVTGSTSTSAIVYINGASTSTIFDNIEITNCRLDETYASENPVTYIRAIFYVASKTATVTLTNSEISNNYGPMYGGVIESKSKMTVENTVISDNVVNTSFNGANGGEYLIWASDDNADISMANCVITANTIVKTTKGLFYNQKGKINVEYCDIGDNKVDKFVGATGTITADNNWWGTNDQPDTKVNKWVIMNVETDDSDLSENNKVTFTVDFNHVLTSSGNLENLTGGEIPKDKYTVTLTAKNGEITPTSIVVNKGQTLTKTFTVTEINDEITLSCDGDDVTVILEGIPPYRGIIYVNTTGNDANEGSIDAPVATIAKAVELALANGGSGEIIIDEGTYVGNGYHINGDLNVTANGKVTLDANNEGRLFYMEYGDSASKIELHNLVLTNATGFGAAVYSLANELILDNVTIVNNQASNYLITSKGKLTIKDSEISNSMSGDVVQQIGNGDILINNTIFKDNSIVDSTSVMAVINLNTASGNLVVENSKFINNTARQGVIKGNYNYNINVKGTEFIDNTNTVSYGGAIYTSGGTLDVTDSVFVNNKAARSGGAIYVGYRTTATVEKSVFVNNTANTMSDEYYGDAIYDGNKLTVNNSVLLTNSNNFLIYSDGEDNVPYAQNNWWGTNDDPSSLNGYGYYEDDDWDEYDCPPVDVSNWVTMDASFVPADAQAGDEVTVTATFSNANLPDGINVTFTSTSGYLNTVVSTVDAQASTTYTIDTNDEAIVAASGNATVNMPITQDLSNIVTNDTFYNFFDESGILRDNVTYDKLIFQGEFSDLAAGYVIITKSVTITGDNAVLNNMGFMISSEDVALDKLTLVATTSLGSLITVTESNVDLTNLNISYIVGDEEAIAINVKSEDEDTSISDVNILNSNIYFESHVSNDEGYATAINLEVVEDVIVDGNNITASVPALYVETYDLDYFMMGLVYVNPVRIYEGDGVEFTNNNLDVVVNDCSASFPTTQSIYIVGSQDVLIKGNNFTMIDTATPIGTSMYLYAVECGFSDEISFIENNFNISTTGGKSGAGSAYALQVATSEVEIIGNNLTCDSNGPNLGIFSPYGFGQAKDMVIKDNFLNISGYAAGSNDFALISGIEIQTGYATIYNNTIYVLNKGDYDDAYPVSGISAVQYSASTLTFDVKDNEVYTNGKYAVDMLYPPQSAVVVGNTLYANELKGDAAVYIKSGNNNEVHDNLPTNIVTNATFYNFFDENGMLLDTITFDELIFQGEFSDLVDIIVIPDDITLTGDNAVLNNIALSIIGDDVTVTGFTLNENDADFTTNGGAAIYVIGSDVTLDNVSVTYNAPDEAEAKAIFANGADNFKLINSEIIFAGTDPGENHYRGLEVRKSDGAVIDNNTISAVLPAVPVKWDGEGIGQDLVLAVGIQGGDDVEFTNNRVTVNTNGAVGSYPTIDAVMVHSANDIIIKGNNLTHLDTTTEDGARYYYSLDLYNLTATVEANNIIVNTTAGVDRAGTAYPIQLTGPFTVTVKDNNLTAVSKGPIAGIYASNWPGAGDLTVENNNIDVYGYATTGNYALVAGIEAEIEMLKVYNNDITVENGADYDDANQVIGVGIGASWFSGNPSADIKDNTITVDGKYAVYYAKAINSNVTGNTLYGHELEGDDAAIIESGSNNIIKDNLPLKPYEGIIYVDVAGSDDNNGSIDAPVATIAKAVELALTGSGKIIVNEGTYDAPQIEITGDLDIAGNGTVVFKAQDATKKAFWIKSGNVNISGVTFTNFNATYNGAVIRLDAGSLAIDKSKFIKNGGENRQALIQVKGADLTLTNTVFEDNTASKTGTSYGNVYLTNNGDKISTLYANNVTFKNNYNKYGAFYLGSTIATIYNSSFIGNNATSSSGGNGAAIYASGTATYISTYSGKLINGSASYVLIEGCEFINNTAFGGTYYQGQGGAIYVNNNVTMFINDCLFENNKVMNTTGNDKPGQGGAIYASAGKVIIDRSVFKNNGAAEGSEIYMRYYNSHLHPEEVNILNITNSIILNDGVVVVADSDNGTYIANNNWWGANDNISDKVINVTVDSWAKMDASFTPEGAYKGEVNVTAVFDNPNLPDGINVTFTSTSGALDTTVATVGGKATTTYTIDATDEAIIATSTDAVVEMPIIKPLANITVVDSGAWIGTNGTVTVTVPNATGTITIEINNKTYIVDLVNGVATQEIPAEDLVAGENAIVATYNGPDFATNNATGVLCVISGVVTQENYMYYFNQSDNGKFFDYIPEGVTLDFQGSIINPDQEIIVQMNVNKPVNIISSTGDAYVDLNTTAGSLLGESPGNSFAITYGGSGSNVTGIRFHNTQLWFSNTHNVILDNISNVVEDQRVGSGVGATSIRDNSTNVTLKNSYFYTRNNGGSTTFTFSWASNCTIDNCTIKAEGNVGNLLYLNIFNVVGAPSGVPLNNYNVVSNNKIYGKEGSGISVGLMVEGKGNLIVNNTLYKSSISTSFGGVNPSDNVYVGNTMTAGSGLTALANSIVYGNNVTGALSTGTNSVAYDNIVGGKMTVAAGATAYNNTVGNGLATGGTNAVIENNTITGAVTINKVGTTFVGNNVTGTVTVSANNNVIKGNNITTTGNYAVDLGSKTGNNVTDNYLVSASYGGDAAVKYSNENNIVENNCPKGNLTADRFEDGLTINIGDKVLLNVTLTDDAGKVISGATVVFLLNDTEYTAVTDAEGKAYFDLSGIAIGDYLVNYRFDGNEQYSKCNLTVNDKLTVSKIPTEINVTSESISLEIDEEVNVNATLTPADAGILNYTSSNESVAIVDANGKVIAISEGNANITVSFAGDENYTAANVTVTVTVSKVSTEISIENDTVDMEVNDEVATGATLTPADAGNVTYTVSNSSVVKVEDGKIIALAEGSAVITVSFAGDDKYAAAENKTISVTVTLKDASVSVENATLNLLVDENATIVAVTSPEGLNVTYLPDNSGVVSVDENGVVTALKEGTASIIVKVGGDGVYAENTTAVTVTVSKVPTEISVNPASLDLVVGNESSIVANLTPADAGIVTFTSSDDSVVTVDEEGNVVAVGEGSAVITVSFAGDDKYAAAENVNVSVSVAPKPKENATISIDVPGEVTEGDNVTVTVTLPEDATGSVTIGNEVVPLVNGTASAVLTNIPAGNTTVPITYSGDDKYNSIETSITINADEKPVPPKENLTISATADPITVGENATIVVSGFEDATGNVTAKVGNGVYTTTIVDGTAVFTISGLIENVTADITYAGDDKYNSASTTVDIVVNPKEKENATISIDVPGEVTEGDNVTVAVNLPEDATGTVTIGNEVVPVVNGTASAVLTNLPAGNTTVPIVYSGDDKYNSIETSITINADEKPVPPKENLTISATADPITVGENATIVVSGFEDATGNVTVTVNGKTYNVPINEGKATITVPGLTENTTATISYPGDDKYNSAFASVDIVVNPKPKENATISIDVPPVTEGQNTIINVELPKDATGNVTATVDGKTYTAPVVNGTATITIPELAAGNYTVPVTYSGDDKYNPLTEEVNITVDEDKSDIIKAPDVTKYFHGPERFVVTITDYQGNPLANKSVTIVINSATYTRTTDTNGTASIGLGLNSGVYNATVTVDNKTINSVVTILSTVNGTDIVKIFRNGTQYFATFRDSEGKYLADGTTVRFNINGVMYDRKVAGDKGLAKLNINLEAGEYVITAMNLVTGDLTANNITVLSRITENADLVKYYRNASQYTVKVLGDDGKAVGAGQTVRFNINGVIYERQTDANGVAKININLQPGDYIITAEYQGSVVSNNIKVLPILTASDISMKYRDGTQFKATLVDGQGKPYVGQSVSFNINGVFYYRVTDSTGIAKLNINLMPGEYIITSSYNGASIANTVKISA